MSKDPRDVSPLPDPPMQDLPGRPACPPWCETDHDRRPASSHQGRRAVIHVPGRAEFPDEITVEPVAHLAARPRVEPYVRLGALRLAHDEASPFLALTPADAAQLAGIVDMLAGATPDQHRELAAAIRHAAGQIAGEQ